MLIKHVSVKLALQSSTSYFCEIHPVLFFDHGYQSTHLEISPTFIAYHIWFFAAVRFEFLLQAVYRLLRSVCGAREGDNLEALPISSSLLTISILFYPEMFNMRGLEYLFLPLSPAQVFFSVRVYPGCTGMVCICWELLRDVFMLSRSPVFEITHTSDASLADRILGLCTLIKDVAPLYTVIYSGDFFL